MTGVSAKGASEAFEAYCRPVNELRKWVGADAKVLTVAVVACVLGYVTVAIVGAHGGTVFGFIIAGALMAGGFVVIGAVALGIYWIGAEFVQQRLNARVGRNRKRKLR